MESGGVMKLESGSFGFLVRKLFDFVLHEKAKARMIVIMVIFKPIMMFIILITILFYNLHLLRSFDITFYTAITLFNMFNRHFPVWSWKSAFSKLQITEIGLNFNNS